MNDAPAVKHSGLGIAALILSILIGTTEFVMIVVAAIIESASEGGMDEDSVGAIVLGLIVIGGCFLAFVGLILGVAGLFQKDRKKVFPVLGTAFNAMILLAVAGLIIIGLLIG
jgi:hypothetical protein